MKIVDVRKPRQEQTEHAPVDKKGMQAIAQQIEQEDAGQTSDDSAPAMSHLDAEDLAIGHAMESGASRPDDFTEDGAPKDMGLAEDGKEDSQEIEPADQETSPEEPAVDKPQGECDKPEGFVPPVEGDPTKPEGFVAPVDEDPSEDPGKPEGFVPPVEGDVEEQHDEDPEMIDILRDGLDSHADSIKQDKVRQMVGEALEGFKANKQVLERAKTQAPEFYNASITMLKVMIEMASMLGLSAPAENPQDSSENPAENPMDEPGTPREPAGNLPETPDTSSPSEAAAGGPALAPKKRGQ
jgi:hypothetical protein